MKLIILDRDGVINFDSANYIKSPEEWLPIPGSLEAIARLKQSGYTIAIATNQSGIARGFYTVSILAVIHNKMQSQLAQFGAEIDAIFYCPHLPDDGCDCRKPKPGLLHQISEYFKTPLAGVYMIGDTKRDLDAAVAAGATPLAVRSEMSQADLKQYLSDPAHFFENLSSAVDAILNNQV